MNLPVAGILDVQCCPLSAAGDLELRGEARWRLDRALICVCYGATAPLLVLPHLLPPTHYHSVSLSLPPEARTLAPAAWQPLVSFTQLLCCLSHSEDSRCTPPLSAAPGWMQQTRQNMPPLFLLPLYSLSTQI